MAITSKSEQPDPTFSNMSFDPSFNHHFPWQWILPSTEIVMADHANGYHHRFGGNDEAKRSSIAVINADTFCISKDIQKTLIDGGYKHYVLFGSNYSVNRVKKHIDLKNLQVRDYGLIPPNAPRVVVPLTNARVAALGLRLHTPGSRFARAAVFVLRQFIRIGVIFPLRRRRLLIASKSPYSPWPLTGLNPEAFSGYDFALYLGTGDAERKTVALPIGKSEPKQIIKTAEHPVARAKLENEALMLRYLATTPLANRVPILESFDPGNIVSVLVQRYFRAETTCTSERDASAIDFLNACFRINSSNLSLAQYLRDRLPSTAGTSTQKINVTQLLDCLLQRYAEIQLPISLTHGDFAPWNFLFVDSRIIVIDWEEGNRMGLSTGDAFSYVVLQELLIRSSRNPVKIATKALALAHRIYIPLGISPLQIRISFAVWCLSRNGFPFGEVYMAMASIIIGENDQL